MVTMFMARATFSGPMIDGILVVDDPQTLYQAGKYQHVPMIVGANSADMGMSRATTEQEIFAPFGANQKAAEEAYDASTTKRCPRLGYDSRLRRDDGGTCEVCGPDAVIARRAGLGVPIQLCCRLRCAKS